MTKEIVTRELVEGLVRRGLLDARRNPGRAIRNLLDMGRLSVRGRFQKTFFDGFRRMLQNPASPYYALIENTLSGVDHECLIRFGMNIGYNAWTVGARRIREEEGRLGCDIPWTILFCADADFSAPTLLRAMDEGSALGIRCYMYLCDCAETAARLAELVKARRDEAFLLFFSGAATGALADAARAAQNIMLVADYENLIESEGILREYGCLYGAFHRYDGADVEALRAPAIARALKETRAAFAFTLPPIDAGRQLYGQVGREMEKLREEQRCRVLTMDLYYDVERIDRIISGESCRLVFDRAGHPVTEDGPVQALSLPNNSLTEILRRLRHPHGTV